MSTTQFSVPAARISVMVNMAYLLGKEAISPSQYNMVSEIIEGKVGVTTGEKGNFNTFPTANSGRAHAGTTQTGAEAVPLVPLQEESQHVQRSQQQDRARQNGAQAFQMSGATKDMLEIAGPGMPYFEESKRSDGTTAKVRPHDVLTTTDKALLTALTFGLRDDKAWKIECGTPAAAAGSSFVVETPRPHEQVTLTSQHARQSAVADPRSDPAQTSRDFGASPAALSSTSAASAVTAASNASPRSAQDIRNEFARKVMLAKANGQSANTNRAPLQQIQNQPEAKQPSVYNSSRQQHQQQHQQQQQQSGFQRPVHGDGAWDEEHAKDLRKRLAQIGAPTPTPRRRSTQSSGMTSSGLAGDASMTSLAQSQAAAAARQPLSVQKTAPSLDFKGAQPLAKTHENRQPELTPTKQSGTGGIVPREAWSEW